MKNKISKKDKRDWNDFISSNEKLPDKDSSLIKKTIKDIVSIDLHGYSLDEANKKVKDLIFDSYNNKVRKLKIITGKGPVGKFFSEDSLKEIMKITSAEVGDSIFLACGTKNEVEKILSLARDKIGSDLNLIDENSFAFCWNVDYPMFEKDEETGKIKFSHNPFSMPQGDIDNIDLSKPLEI